jgi:hypothetical protein
MTADIIGILCLAAICTFVSSLWCCEKSTNNPGEEFQPTIYATPLYTSLGSV